MKTPDMHDVPKEALISELSKLLRYIDWGDDILVEAEKECNFKEGYHAVLFPGGVAEIIEYFEQQQDEKALMHLSTLDLPTKIKERIALALSIRIKHFIPKFVHRKNRGYFLMPLNTLLGSKIAWRTCDMIWRYAGDDSTDHNHYSKRALLLPVYISSITYYIADESENQINTEHFIADSLEKVTTAIFYTKKLCKLPSLETIPFIRLFS